MNASVDAESMGEQQLITTLDLNDTTKTDVSVVNEQTAPNQEAPPSEEVSIEPLRGARRIVCTITLFKMAHRAWGWMMYQGDR